MAAVQNSRRDLLQATYSPIVAPPKSPEKRMRVFDKWHYVASARPLLRLIDLEDVRRKLKREARNGDPDPVLTRALHDFEVLKPVLEHTAALDPVAAAKAMIDVPAESILAIGEAAVEIARKRVRDLADAHIEILEKFGTATVGEQMSARVGSRGEIVQQTGNVHTIAAAPNSGAVAPATAKAALDDRSTAQAPPRLKDVALWAMSAGVRVEEAKDLLKVAARFETGAEPLSVQAVLATQVRAIETLNESFRRLMQVEPVGWLHLERLSFTPVGLERGELVQSVALSPGEEVNISHREWSNTSTELQDMVTDYLENFSEQGVTEKSELADSTSHQNQHSDSFNTSHTVSGGFGSFINLSSSLNYSVQDSASTSVQSSQKHSKDLTSKASSRSKKEHKISFRVASAKGTEDAAVKLVKNPDQNKPMRLDYYRLMAKWRVDLERYGVRLTYDLTIPEPGNDLMEMYYEIEELESKLTGEFDFPLDPSQIKPQTVGSYEKTYDAVVPKAPADPVTTTDTKNLSWDNTGTARNAHGHAVLDLEVDPKYQITDIQVDATFRTWVKSDNPAGEPEDDVPWPVFRVESVGFPGYTLTSEVNLPVFRYDRIQQAPVRDLGSVSRRLTYKVSGASSKGSIVFFYSQLQAFSLSAVATAKLRDEEKAEWQISAWNVLREAAENAHKMSHQRYQDRLDELRAKLAGYDALTLRKMEREEIMKGVIRWLFGPEFRFYPKVPVIPPLLPPSAFPTPADWTAYEAYRQALSAAGGAPLDAKGGVNYYTGEQTVVSELVRQEVLSFGEFIKFFHNAIEWENMLFILYPYFWTQPSEWPSRLYLRHPDRIHELFLRAGAARVVLTIRPGYEERFLSLMETADLYALKDKQDHPYQSIAEEMRNYAKTNFAGLPSINKPDHGAAWRQIQAFKEALEFFNRDCGRYPTPAEGLQALKIKPAGANGWAGPYVSTIPLDPWGHEYRYQAPGTHGAFDIVSLGETGQEPSNNGKLPDDAIVSWAEGTLVGSWFEYTPTSALDIAIGETVQ